MASIFTYQEEPHRVHSPWSTPGSNTPQITVHVQEDYPATPKEEMIKVTRLEPERHDGPIEYKLHLLLRWRRTFTYTSTTVPQWAPPISKHEMLSPSAPVSLDSHHGRTTYQPTTQARQQRLQQLTTQLLWRLQQSSPFHSSSNAKLVLPVLPEATPRLGVPDRPSKLLPGLEESQGALYEIGVADDGTLVGLADEELEESLTNLRAMAASLGCVVDIHRRVIVGRCEWQEPAGENLPPITKTSKLWVAEVLVRPDNKNVEIVPTDPDAISLTSVDSCAADRGVEEVSKEQIRVAIIGASTAGKSSLLGTLTTSGLDNGRGKSRLSLLKHRHEIASGITSSVAQELIGYRVGPPADSVVVNYATGDVSSWPDIHNLSDRLVFLSDSPGLPRYAKSAFRALISWSPAWTILCIPVSDVIQQAVLTTSMADAGSVTEQIPQAPDMSLAHLQLCLKLGRPIIIAMTKVDMMNRVELKSILGRVLTAIKSANRIPVMLNLESLARCKEEVDMAFSLHELVAFETDRIRSKLEPHRNTADASVVPIIITSAVTGFGIPTLHALLRDLSISNADHLTHSPDANSVAKFSVDEVFAIPPSKVYSMTEERAHNDSGIVLCGTMQAGQVKLGDVLELGPFVPNTEQDLDPRDFTRRSSSHQQQAKSQPLVRSLSDHFSRSMQLGSKHLLSDEVSPCYVPVKVVSLRSLRLSTTKMQSGETGTIGIQPYTALPAGLTLSKARKGMLLTTATAPQAYRSFTATFPASDFSVANAPPIILGGHAIVYMHSIRAAVKVISLALDDNPSPRSINVRTSHRHTASDSDVFHLSDSDEDSAPRSRGETNEHVRVTFRFVSSVEAFEEGEQVLIVPGALAAGPVSGAPAIGAVAGISGFVGVVCGRST